MSENPTSNPAPIDLPWLAVDLPGRLAERLAMPLPGSTVQVRFEPELSFGRHYAPPPPNARQAAVMVLLYPEAGDWHLPLTVRPATMLDHAGQVSFPGGSVDPGETSEAAALRELEEELGVPRDQVRMLGRLSPLYVFASNFHVTPWVAVAERRPLWIPSPAEVAELLEPPLGYLRDRGRWGTHTRRVRELEFRAPHIEFGGHQIWGATCMMLAELLAVVEEFEAPPG